jgi:hypothetical protein
MTDAFGNGAQASLPRCRGRRPHLRDFQDECPEQLSTLLLGASNSWFPVLHGAACLFAPETSGNRYLDRSLPMPTIDHPEVTLFSSANLL